MKHNHLAVIACLTLIVAGVFFAANNSEARVFVSPGNTGCTAPANGASIGQCGTVKSHTSVSKPWHHHWHHHHFRFHYFRGHHFRAHHFSHRGGHRSHGGHGHHFHGHHH